MRLLFTVMNEVNDRDELVMCAIWVYFTVYTHMKERQAFILKGESAVGRHAIIDHL